MASDSKDDPKKESWHDLLRNLYWIVIILFVWNWIWYSKLRYAIQYTTPYSQVSKDKEPHDCDWLKAPLGDKECHFEIQVNTVRTARNAQGQPIVSFNEGETWVLDEATPPTKSQVFISWKKVAKDE
ncbi:MAG: hypothetical protein ABSB15_23340 [Bryobacteraceae bacterium]